MTLIDFLHVAAYNRLDLQIDGFCGATASLTFRREFLTPEAPILVRFGSHEVLEIRASDHCVFDVTIDYNPPEVS